MWLRHPHGASPRSMEKVRWKNMITSLCLWCLLCYHGRFRPGSGADGLLRSMATTNGHEDTSEFIAMKDISQRIQVIDTPGSGQSGEFSAHRDDSPTKDYQPSESALMTDHVQSRRLGLSIPSGKGQMSYFLVCIGTAGLVAAVYGGGYGRRRWSTESEVITSRRVPRHGDRT